MFVLKVDFKVLVRNDISCQGDDFIQGSILRFLFVTLYRKVILGAPLFKSGVDFNVFDPKICVFKATTLVLRSRFLSSW